MSLVRCRELIAYQEKSLKKVNGLRFFNCGYEYKVVWEGGITCFVSLWRREIGKRNFKYYHGFGAYKFWCVGQVLDEIDKMIGGN